MTNTQMYHDYKVHVSKRMRTRFDINIDPDIIMSTLKSCVCHGTYIKDSGNYKKLFVIRAFKKQMVLVYNHKHGLPITVMPKHWI